MEINLTEIVVSLIGLLSTILTVVLVPYIKGKLTEAQEKELAKWVEIAVHAMEQVVDGTEMGITKKEKVIKYLALLGIDITDERIASQIELLIESFVAKMNGKTQPKIKA